MKSAETKAWTIRLAGLFMQPVLSAACILALFIHSLPTYAGFIDFTDGTGNGTTTFTKVIGGSGAGVGAQATFSDPIIESGAAGGNDFSVHATEGLGLGTGSLAYSWNVVFNQTVQLEGWTAFLAGSSSSPFSIVGAGVNSTFAFSDTSISLLTPLTLLSGDTYNFSTPARFLDPPFIPGGIVFQSWEFTAVSVPEPASLVLMSLGLAGLGFARKQAT